MTEDWIEEARKKVEYYEDTAKILLEEGVQDIAVDFYILAGMYSLLIKDENGRKYFEKAVEICRSHGISGHREIFVNIGVRILKGEYEGIEEEWEKIKGEYSEEEDKLIKELLKMLRKSITTEEAAQEKGEEWEIAEEEWVELSAPEEISGGHAEVQSGEQVVMGEAEESVVEGKQEETITIMNLNNIYGRISISEIAWRIGENKESVKQVLDKLIQNGRITGKIEGDYYVQSEVIGYQMLQTTSKPQKEEKPTFLSALKEKDVTAPAKPGYKRCGVCGEEIPEAYMICTHCGARQ